MSVSKCVICAQPVSNLFQRNSLEDQVAVVFFLQKFLKYSLLAEDEASLKYVLEILLQNEGNPSNWLSFCASCLPWVQQAQSLYKIISELEGKLEILRRKVERKVVISYEMLPSPQSSYGESDIIIVPNIFHTVRDRIYQENVFMKVPETAHPFMEIELKNQLQLSSTSENLHLKISSTDTRISLPVMQNNVVEQIEEQNQSPEQSDVLYIDEDATMSREEEIIEIYDSNDDPIMGLHINEVNVQQEADDVIITQLTTVENLQTPSKAIAQAGKESPLNSKQSSNLLNCSTEIVDLTQQKRKTDEECRTCPVCSVVFEKDRLMWWHFNEQHKSRIFRCSFCNKGFTKKKYLLQHIVKKSHSTPFDFEKSYTTQLKVNGMNNVVNQPDVIRNGNISQPLLSLEEESNLANFVSAVNYSNNRSENQSKIVFQKNKVSKGSKISPKNPSPILRSILSTEAIRVDDECQIINS